ncbi:hypothetical protein M0805_000049 [Coniferiporia weirii]|nr:hypothetical protein M0805_000049 [Coniferiporia weirii]
MPRDMCSVRISGIRGDQRPIRHTPYQKPVSLDDNFVPAAPVAATPVKALVKLETIPSPPHTPPALSHSPAVTPCTSAEPSPFRVNTVLPDPEPAQPSGSSSRKSDDTHVRRPANPFILFACEYRKGHKGKNNRELSKEAGALWKLLSDPEKQKWRDLATSVKEKHAEEHPGYRYQPRRREKPRRPQRDLTEAPKRIAPVATTFPMTPKSLPRKKTAPRPVRVDDKVQIEDNDNSLHTSLLSSPTFRAGKALGKARDFTELPPVGSPFLASELALASLPQPRPTSVAPVAGPSTAAPHLAAPPEFNIYGADGSYVPQHWLYLPQNATDRWEITPSSFPNLASAAWDPSFGHQLAQGVDNPNLSTSANDEYVFFNQYGQPTLGFGPAFSMLGGRAGSPFIDGGASLNGV